LTGEEFNHFAAHHQAGKLKWLVAMAASREMSVSARLRIGNGAAISKWHRAILYLRATAKTGRMTILVTGGRGSVVSQ